MGFLFESDVDRRRREAREEWQAREDIKYTRRLDSEAKREENAQQREAQRAARARAAELKRDREKQAAEYAKQEQAARPALTERVGGTRGVKVVTVHHHLSGGFPVALLPPHESRADRLVFAADVMLDRDPSKQHDGKFMDATATARPLFEEITRDYGALLSRLRDHTWWDSLCDSVGVTLTKDGSPRPWKGRYASGVQRVTLVHSPVIMGVKIATDGLRIRIRARVGDGAGRWSSPAKLDLLRSAFQAAGVNARDMTVGADSRGNIVLAFRDRDPLAEPPPSVITPYDAKRGRAFLGITADGGEAWVTIKNNASTLIAGMQGSGKTASLMPLVAGLAGHVELHIVDCGASGEWEIFEPACASYDDSGDLAVVAEVMEYALAASVERMKRVKRTGAINYWEMDEAQRRQSGLVPVVFILEEAPQALGQGQATSDDKKLAERNMALVGKAAKTIRKAGMSLIIITQKPAATEIPTIIRDNAGQRISFRLDSETAAATVFGDAAYVDPKPTSIPTGKPGRFIARLDQRGSVMGQAPYLPVEEISEYVSAQRRIPKLGDDASSSTLSRGSNTPTPEQVAAMTEQEKAEWMHRHAVEMGWVPSDTKVPATDGTVSSEPVTDDLDDTDTEETGFDL